MVSGKLVDEEQVRRRAESSNHGLTRTSDEFERPRSTLGSNAVSEGR